MGDSRNEEATDFNGFRIAAKHGGGMPFHGMSVAWRPGEPDLPAGDGGHLWGTMCDALPTLHVRPLRWRTGDDYTTHAWPGNNLRTRAWPLIVRKPTMKKLMMLLVLGILLVGTTGCHVGECWRWAWNSRFHPERNAPAAQHCIMVDPCDQCCDPCGGGGAPMVVPAPVCCH
jgi:hypothetical protein